MSKMRRNRSASASEVSIDRKCVCFLCRAERRHGQDRICISYHCECLECGKIQFDENIKSISLKDYTKDYAKFNGNLAQEMKQDG